MKKLMALLSDNTTGPRIFGISIVGIILISVIATIIINNANAPKYVQGDFSEFSCNVYGCENSPTWRLTYGSRYYYCDEHESEGRALYNRYTSKNSGSSERTMGKCWICGKEGSFQLDGSYYCFKHYNDRLSGKIG